MGLKDKLPVSYLLFTTKGRVNRRTYWTVSIFIWTTFYILFNLLEFAFSYSSTLIVYPLLFWALIATATKRLHDSNKAGFWLWLILIPVLGPLLLIFLLAFKRGSVSTNRFGVVPGSTPDYFRNPDAEKIPHLKTEERIVNDVTQLNPVLVSKVETPTKVEQLRTIIQNAEKPVCIGGGRFSMGGQTVSPHCIHIDTRRLNKILDFSATDKTIKVEAGSRWCDIQHYMTSII